MGIHSCLEAYFDGSGIVPLYDIDGNDLSRQVRGLTVAQTYRHERVDGQIWFNDGHIRTLLLPDHVGCSCPDMAHRLRPCKHVYAAALLLTDQVQPLPEHEWVKAAAKSKAVQAKQSTLWGDEPAATGARPSTYSRGKRAQDIRMSKYFILSDFVYSHTGILKGVPNMPEYDSPEVDGIRGLATNLLDPIVEQFGQLSITYGFCTPELWRLMYGGRSMTSLHTFKPPRNQIGGACDILVHAFPDDPRPVLNWIRQSLVYDRLIIYPQSPILCVGWTHPGPRMDCKEWVYSEAQGKRVYVDAGWDAPPDV